MVFKAGQGYMNAITFSGFDPENPSKINLSLADLKIFGRNLEKQKILRVLETSSGYSLYVRTRDNVVCYIQNVREPEDLNMKNLVEIEPIPDLITDFFPFKVQKYLEYEYCVIASRKGMLRLHRISVNVSKIVMFNFFRTNLI